MSHTARKHSISRRQFLNYVGAGAGACSIAGLRVAEAGLLPAPKKSEKTGVVVIGTGLAGFAAALQAQSAGAKVVILEKRPGADIGGNTSLAGGLIAIPRENTKEAKDEYYEDFLKKSMGKGNAELTRLLADRSLDDADWLKAQGVEFLPPIAVAGYRVKAALFAPGLFRGAPAAIAKLRETFERRGGKIAFETKAKQLVMDTGGAVIGVRAATADGVKDYLADGVVIAAGGYGGSKQLLEQFVDPDADDMMVRGRIWATGDGLLMAQEAGAVLTNMGGIGALHIAAVSPTNTASGNPFTAVAYCLGINRAGKRYVDESLGYVANGKAAMRQPGQVVALIFDEEIKKQSGVGLAVRQFQGLNIPIQEADTLEGLADKIGVPPAALVQTVAEFNAAVQGEAAPGAKPAKAKIAFKVATPKFYAFAPLVPGITLTFGGIRINAAAQVQEGDGRVIPGLYAAGECAGGLFYDDYIGGASLANCVVMGRIAGASAAERGAKRRAGRAQRGAKAGA